MDKQIGKEVTLLCIVSLIASIGFFAREWLFAYDSYFFVSFSRHLVPFNSHYFGFSFVLGYLPESFLVFELLMFLCLFVSVLGLYFGLRQVFSQSTSFLATLICLAGAPVMIFSFAQFQNELFSYPFIFWSFYCLMKKERFFSWYALAFALCGAFFWLGSLVWVGVIAFGLIIPFIIALIVGSSYFMTNVGYAFGKIDGVAFNTPFFGLIDFFLLLPFVFGVFLVKNRRWQAWTLVALVCVCLSARYEILLIPSIGLGTGVFLDKAKNKGWLVD